MKIIIEMSSEEARELYTPTEKQVELMTSTYQKMFDESLKYYTNPFDIFKKDKS